MISIKISSAEKALVDNVKALLESVAWEEEAPRGSEAAAKGLTVGSTFEATSGGGRGRLEAAPAANSPTPAPS